MNERIKELAKAHLVREEHTEFGWQECHQYSFDEDELTEFAELIVGECIEQVKGQYVPVIEDTEMMKDTHWDGYVQCGVDSVVAIREHFFGVEE